MPDEPSPGADAAAQHINRLENPGGAGDVVQARDVHGGVHFHHEEGLFAVTPRQLPGLPQRFVDRDGELAALVTIVADDGDDSLVVVITGTAGVGKTSLALRWAHNLRDRYPDGQLYVDLRGYDPGQPAAAEYVLGRFVRDLGVPARAVPADVDERAALYRSILDGRRMLVLLDNAATVGQVRPLLPGSPGCLAIVTSRSRLSGLVAREGAHRLRLDLLEEEQAVALLRAVISDYRSGDNGADLAELARLCAWLPLALRIAAERAASRPMMGLHELIADLRDESGLWDALSVEGGEEADAVRTVFAWSYRALPERAARLFRLLGLHPGDEFGVPATAALTGTGTREARADLDALVGAHLIEQTGTDHYRFHDLLRAYAIDQVRQLEPDHERADAVRRVLAWYLHTAGAAQTVVSPFGQHVLTEPVPVDVLPLEFGDYEAAMCWYQAESANLVAAVRAADGTGECGIAWQLAAVLGGIYMHQNAFDDWIITGRIGVEAAMRCADPSGQAVTLDSLGKAFFQSRRLREAERCHRRAFDIRREQGDRFGEARSVNALGMLGLRHRSLGEAIGHFQRGAQIFAELGERRWAALLRVNLAEVYCERGEFELAVDLLRAALPVFEGLGDRFGEGNGLFVLAWALREMGRLHEAQAAIGDAVAIAEADRTDVWRAHWLVELARIQLAQHEPADALDSAQRAAVIQRRLGDRSREAMAIDGAGQAYQQLERYDEAAKFHRQAARVHRDLGDRWQLALSLDHLAIALDHLDEPEEAREHRREALSSLADFDDPPAIEMRQRLDRTLRAT